MYSTRPDLYPYQREGADWLTENPRAYLAWEQGLGKTATALRAAAEVNARNIVVICPAVARINWQREAALWAPEIESVLTFSYDEISRNGPDRVPAGKIDVLILDEAHYLKERTSARTKHILGTCRTTPRLIDRADIVWCLSGTPTPNHAGEIWPVAWALFPKDVTTVPEAGGYPTFLRHYCYTRETKYGTQVSGHRRDRLMTLREKLKPYVNRLKKVQVLDDLPDLEVGVVPVEAEAALVNAEVKRLAQEHPELGRMLAAVEEGKDHELVSPHLATLRRLTGQLKAPLVAELVKEALYGGGKAIVFAHHRSVIGHLQGALSSLGCVVLDGSTPTDTRQQAIDWFQTDPKCRVFIGQIGAAGTAITLTAASNVFFAEASWVPADNAQAVARAHRIGQKSKVLARFVSLAGTIDEAVMRVLSRKVKDLRSFWEDKHEVYR